MNHTTDEQKEHVRNELTKLMDLCVSYGIPYVLAVSLEVKNEEDRVSDEGSSAMEVYARMINLPVVDSLFIAPLHRTR